MMTEQRKRRLRDKIQESRERLMKRHPFLAMLLMYVKYVAVREMKKMSTNARCIYFSPDFLDKLRTSELDYLLAHQVMHIVLDHIWRPEADADDDYHFACDVLVNQELEKIGFQKDRYPHLGDIHDHIPGRCNISTEGLTPKEVRDLLAYSLYVFDERTRSRFMPDSDVYWDPHNDPDSDGILILDIPDMSGALPIELQGKNGAGGASEGDGGIGENAGESGGGGDSQISPEDWKEIVYAVSKSMKQRHDGEQGYDSQTAGLMERILGKRQKASVDWRKLLQEFLQENVNDYSFTPPDRRFSDSEFFLPDFNEKESTTREILFMVDTSGSVKDENLAIVYSEICGAIEQFNGKICGKLGFFDAAVSKAPCPFETVEDVLQILPYGGGGTDFGAIFRYIREEMSDQLPSCIIIFTDGDGPFPLESAALGIPVMWLLDNEEVTPPWGKRVVVQNNHRERNFV